MPPRFLAFRCLTGTILCQILDLMFTKGRIHEILDSFPFWDSRLGWLSHQPLHQINIQTYRIQVPHASISGLGKISFPTSGSPEAQPWFLRGVLLLHNFQYDDAKEAFRKSQTIDPDFAMAYWGEAMTENHTMWIEQDPEEARAILNRLGPTPGARLAKAPTQREKMYVRAIETLYGHGDKQSPRCGLC